MKRIYFLLCAGILSSSCSPISSSLASVPLGSMGIQEKPEKFWFSEKQKQVLRWNAFVHHKPYFETYINVDFEYTQIGDTCRWDDAQLVAVLKPSQVMFTQKICPCSPRPEIRFT